ncbi:hypothetical protein SASPL_114888 [Salvia splendens]|uniref:Uncharacterized protein n=1 Tax=Salvia splendens TaxID=180675 RepID=A0A8X8Y1G1_SALSN|nr:hypothetical protein SASPL_114888 [Salvia splendens]
MLDAALHAESDKQNAELRVELEKKYAELLDYDAHLLLQIDSHFYCKSTLKRCFSAKIDDSTTSSSKWLILENLRRKILAQLRSGRTSGEAQQYTRKHQTKSKTVKQATHKLDADPGNKIPDPEGKTSAAPKKNASSAPQVPTEIPATKSTTSSAPKKNASNAHEIPHSEGKTSAAPKKNASSAPQVPTEIPATKSTTSSAPKKNASNAPEIPHSEGF